MKRSFGFYFGYSLGILATGIFIIYILILVFIGDIKKKINSATKLNKNRNNN